MCVGVITYAVYRTTLGAILEWIGHSKCGCEIRRSVPLISDRAARTMVARWKASVDVKNRKQICVQYMTVWSDYIHFMYTSGLCIFVGAIVGCHMKQKILPWDPLFGCTAILLLLSALIADWRLYRVEDILLKR